MNSDNVLKLLEDYKSSSNKELIKALEFLSNDFEKTKDLIVKLTHHLDSTEYSYNKLLDEYKKRINNA